jgi:hypothetical protein
LSHHDGFWDYRAMISAHDTYCGTTCTCSSRQCWEGRLSSKLGNGNIQGYWRAGPSGLSLEALTGFQSTHCQCLGHSRIHPPCHPGYPKYYKKESCKIEDHWNKCEVVT